MTAHDLPTLALLSVTDPRDAARRLLALDLGAAERRDAFLLVVASSGLLMGMASLGTDETTPIPVITHNPILFALFMGCGLWGMIQLTTLAGRMLGGVGARGQLAVLLIWVQALRLAAQAVMLLMMALPGGGALSTLLGVAVTMVGLWISAVFVDEAHGFGNILKSFGVLALAGLGVIIGLSVLWSLVGVGSLGTTSDV